MTYRYYVRGTDEPLVKCPNCKKSLTEGSGIDIHISAGGREFDVSSCLTPEGVLLDVDDLIENGYHAGTACGHCGEPLVNEADEEEVEE